jgi:hypothetical protein
VAFGNLRDAPEREDGLLEVGLLRLDGLDAEVFHAGLVQHDGVRVGGRIKRGDDT